MLTNTIYVSKNQPIIIVVDFYDDNEISAAKELLHIELVKLLSEDVPRLIKRKGDNRGRLNVDGVIALLTRADETGNLSNSQVFVAANPDRLPYMKPDDLNMCILARKLLSIKSSKVTMFHYHH